MKPYKYSIYLYCVLFPYKKIKTSVKYHQIENFYIVDLAWLSRDTYARKPHKSEYAQCHWTYPFTHYYKPLIEGVDLSFVREEFYALLLNKP